MEGHTYSQPVRVTYSYGLLNFATALTTTILPPPTCNAGRVVDIHVRVTTTFTQVTTPAYVQIGVNGTPAKYAQLNMGAAAAGSPYNLTSTGGTPYIEANAAIYSDINLVRDAVSQIQVTIVPPTGGTPAGAGYLDVALAWF